MIFIIEENSLAKNTRLVTNDFERKIIRKK